MRFFLHLYFLSHFIEICYGSVKIKSCHSINFFLLIVTLLLLIIFISFGLLLFFNFIHFNMVFFIYIYITLILFIILFFFYPFLGLLLFSILSLDILFIFSKLGPRSFNYYFINYLDLLFFKKLSLDIYFIYFYPILVHVLLISMFFILSYLIGLSWVAG
jgi:hypothetical protein